MNREQVKVLIESGMLQAFVDGHLQTWTPPYEYEGETVPGRWIVVESLPIELPSETLVRVKSTVRRAATNDDALARRKCVAGDVGSRNKDRGILIYVDDNPDSEKPFHVKLETGHFDWFETCFIDEEMSDLEPPVMAELHAA